MLGRVGEHSSPPVCLSLHPFLSQPVIARSWVTVSSRGQAVETVAVVAVKEQTQDGVEWGD